MADTPTMIGVLGTGTISSAVVIGSLTPSDKSGGKTFNLKFTVSARSAAKSEALRERFPAAVAVEADNQKILDACAYVIVSVLPKQADIHSLKHVTRIRRHCRNVLKVSTIFQSDLWASPLLLFSAQRLA